MRLICSLLMIVMSSSAMAGNTKWCGAVELELTGKLDTNYDSVEKGYYVEDSDPCAVEYILTPPNESCNEAASFKAKGTAKIDVGDDGEDVMSLVASDLTCGP